jgi:hypothetical protein
LASAKEIPPGGEGQIDVALKAGKAVGPIAKSVTVTSNDPTNVNIILQIKAELETYFDAKPDRINFGRVNRKQPVTQSVELIGKDLDNIKIKNIHAKESELSKAFSWKQIDSRETGERKWMLEIALNPADQKPRTFMETLIIETDSEKVPSIEVMMSGEITGPITADPQRIYFANYDPGTPMTRPLKITSSEGLTYKLLEITCSDPNFTVANWAKTSASTHDLEVALDPKYTGENIKADLTIKTDSKEQPEIVIPINGYKKRVRPEPGPNAKAASEMKTTSDSTAPLNIRPGADAKGSKGQNPSSAATNRKKSDHDVN